MVGRFLEHSRLFYFANGEGSGQPAWYLGSADMMPRNLDRRVEVLAPVTDDQLRARLQQILDVNLADNVLTWELSRKGHWRRLVAGPDEERIDAHERLSWLNAERVRLR